MYTLYTHPFSQHARRVAALLEAASLPYETRVVALNQGEHLSAPYLAINPNHQVPTLVDGEICIHESGAILRWLCLRHDLSDWYPADLRARAEVEQWLDWTQCRMLRPVIDIVLNTVFMAPNGDQEAVRRGHAAMEELSPILESALEDRQWIAGTATPTIADLALASNITQLGLADAAPDTPNIAAWYGRVCQISGFARTLPPQMATA